MPGAATACENAPGVFGASSNDWRAPSEGGSIKDCIDGSGEGGQPAAGQCTSRWSHLSDATGPVKDGPGVIAVARQHRRTVGSVSNSYTQYGVLPGPYCIPSYLPKYTAHSEANVRICRSISGL